MTSWTPLKRGDLVDVVSPGSASDPQKVAAALKVLTGWGLRARFPKNSIKTYLYHAHADERRLELLQAALTADDSRAVWCMRGGYGSNRLMSELARLRKPKQAKLFVGLSDVTSIHVFLNAAWGWKTLHGPVLERLGKGDLSEDGKQEIHDLVFGARDAVSFRVKPVNAAGRRARRLRGDFVGGNLMTLQSTIGTKVHLETKGKLLFLEEVAERGYRVDRMLYHLRDAGCFRGVRGIFLGEFLGGDEPGGKENYVAAALRRFAAEVDVPVYAGLPVGHGWEQRTLPLGARARLEGTKLVIEAGSDV